MRSNKSSLISWRFLNLSWKKKSRQRIRICVQRFVPCNKRKISCLKIGGETEHCWSVIWTNPSQQFDMRMIRRFEKAKRKTNFHCMVRGPEVQVSLKQRKLKITCHKERSSLIKVLDEKVSQRMEEQVVEHLCEWDKHYDKPLKSRPLLKMKSLSPKPPTVFKSPADIVQEVLLSPRTSSDSDSQPLRPTLLCRISDALRRRPPDHQLQILAEAQREVNYRLLGGVRTAHFQFELYIFKGNSHSTKL